MTAPVLCYHRVGGPLELGVTRVSPASFRRQMTQLARAGWRTLRLEQFAQLWRSSRAIARTFLLTFDDGYASLAEFAYPVLAECGFTATTFLITDYVGRTNTWDVPYALRRLHHLAWPAIEQWRAKGFDFQSHSAAHPRLTWLDDGEASDQLERSRQTLIRRLGPDAGRAVAYPFGAADARIANLARAAGYELGFGGFAPAADALLLGRTPVYLWDVFATPFGLRPDMLGWLGRGVARIANRCAVGTSAMLQLGSAGRLRLRAAPQRRRQENRAR
jgi:peptidoglycan/xylan/chitin deacetylase (PgdA/CDA1 family)